MKNKLATRAFGTPPDGMIYNSVVRARRHVERAKPTQTPTTWGEIAAYAMGVEDRRQEVRYTDGVSSPQDRARYTCIIYLRGAAGLEEQVATQIAIDGRLNDWSTDARPEIVAGLKIGKTIAEADGIQPGTALFNNISDPTVEQALMMKSTEFLKATDHVGRQPGTHLLTGHEASIDGACIMLAQRLSKAAKFSLETIGGEQFDKVEGFDAYYHEGELVYLEVIRLPRYLIALAEIIK